MIQSISISETEDDFINLSEKLQTLSKSLNISYYQMAEKADLGTPDKLYHAIKRKGNLSFKTIWKIIHAFPETNANFLFGTESNPLRPDILSIIAEKDEKHKMTKTKNNFLDSQIQVSESFRFLSSSKKQTY